MKIPEFWTFQSSEVATGFDAHVREQLPWYELATEAVAHIVRHYLPTNGVVYDIGASTGNVGRSIAETLQRMNGTLYAVEQSREMAELYDAPGTLVVEDALAVDYQPHDVAVLFLALQFLSIEQRQELLDRLLGSLKKGGAIVIVDKFNAPGEFFGAVIRRLTMRYKLLTGTPADKILAKELSLAGCQRPLDYREIAPAKQFFCLGEFSGYVLEND